jgi:DNA-binding beta-propeller fold protein YncE/mono/diheme cytochrome c family protein
MRWLLIGNLALCTLCSGNPRSHSDTPTASTELHRSPCALTLLPGGNQALTVNQTSGSISLIDLDAGKVLAELPCGRKPVAVACSRDGKRAAVSNLWSGTISLLQIDGSTLKSAGEARLGGFPRGLVFAPDGETVYAAIGETDEAVQFDWTRREVRHRWSAPHEPRQLAISADGRWLAAASSRSAQVRCWNTQTRQLHWQRTIDDAFNLRGLAFTPDGQHLVVAHVVRRTFPVSQENIGEGWVTDSRLTRLPLQPDVVPPSAQLALDTKGAAVGDPEDLAFSTDGRWLAVAGSGTHELLLFEAAGLPWSGGDPGDFLDPGLAKGDGKFRRVALSGRPMGVAALPDGRIAVANYLLDAVQVVDAKTAKVVQTIGLGSPPRPSLARQGEALFYDANRSHNHWFSCHTCHVDGHTCGLTFDTLNDDSYGNPKLTPSLRGVTHTGPWTWHGWQKDLGASVEKSFTQTMFGLKPTAAEIRAMLAFLATLEQPPNPRTSSRESIQRGQALFQGKAHCVRCHHGEHYTSDRNYDVKLEPDGSPYPLWNPPSLRGLFDRSPYLHDGRASSLEELLEKHHAPEKLGGEALTPAERKDLIAFLLSL